MKKLHYPVNHLFGCECSNTEVKSRAVTLLFVDHAGSAVAGVEIGHEFMMFANSSPTGECYCLYLKSGCSPGISDVNGLLTVPDYAIFDLAPEKRSDNGDADTDLIAVRLDNMTSGALFTLNLEDMGAIVKIPMRHLCRITGKVTSVVVPKAIDGEKCLCKVFACAKSIPPVLSGISCHSRNGDFFFLLPSGEYILVATTPGNDPIWNEMTVADEDDLYIEL